MINDARLVAIAALAVFAALTMAIAVCCLLFTRRQSRRRADEKAVRRSLDNIALSEARRGHLNPHALPLQRV